MLTERNDSLLNSYNPVQLSCAAVCMEDMQYVVSRKRVIQYLAKYARSVYGNIMKGLDAPPCKWHGNCLQTALEIGHRKPVTFCTSNVQGFT